MKNLKLKGFYKFLSLLLIAVLVLSAVGFASSGRESTPMKPDSGDGGNKADEADENKNGTSPDGDANPENDNNTTTDEDKTPPSNNQPEDIFLSKITGLSITEAEYNTIPKGIVVDPQRPLYGISKSDLMIEFPIEDGTSRLVAYTTNAEVMWKIGSLKATRGFISNMSNFFGGVVVSYGIDDRVVYDAWETDDIVLDLSQYSDCSRSYERSEEMASELAQSYGQESFYRKPQQYYP